MNTFSIGESVRFGWDTFKKRPWFFVGVTLLLVIVSGIVSYVVEMFGKDGVPAAAGALVNIVFSTLVGMGTTAFYLKAYETPEAVESGALWHPNGFWRYFATTILAGVAVVIGLILLVVPGIIVAMMLIFASYIVIDRGLGPIEALQESRRITKGYRWKLLGLLLAVIGINILGVLCLVIGMLVSIPVTSLALVHAYRKLEHAASEIAPISAPTPAPLA